MVETQFIVFYDLRVKILNFSEIPETDSSQNPFTLVDKKEAGLTKFYFSDNYPERLVVSHLHVNDDNKAIKQIKKDTKSKLDELGFDFAQKPIGVEKLSSYSWLECTLFYNGILSVVLRLQSKENNDEAKDDFSASKYLDYISRPEYVRNLKPDPPCGALIEAAWNIFEKLEIQICNLLNSLNLDAVQLSNGISNKLKVITREQACCEISEGETKYWKTKKGKTKCWKTKNNDKIIRHCLRRSRPYIGSFIKLGKDEDVDDAVAKDKTEEERLMRLAVACARTTPEFLNNFRNPEKYLHDTPPMRNIYYPGKCIVFIARRGWVCIQREERNNQEAFLLGVIEVVLFIIQATLSSVRATRRYAQELIDESKKMNKLLHDLNESKKKNKFSFMNFSTNKIQKCAEFVARARLSSPANDISSLMESHINTHTGIAAAIRLNQLTFHDDLKNKVNDILKNYDNFLEQAKHNWLNKIVNSLGTGGIIAFFGVLVTVLTFMLKRQ